MGKSILLSCKILEDILKSADEGDKGHRFFDELGHGCRKSVKNLW